MAHSNQILAIHDLGPLDKPDCYSRSYVLWYSRLLPLLVQRVRRILTVSEFCRRRIVEVLRVDEKKISVTSEAASAHFTPRPRTEVQCTLRKLCITGDYFLAVGAVSARKNLQRLLAAWGTVQQELAGITLVLVGKEQLPFARRSVVGGLPSGVKHVTAVSDLDLANLYTGARGLLYPSLYEGFGLPILEAMGCGCPVLTSNCTSMPEIAGGSAVLIDPYDEGSIADGIRYLADERRSSGLRDAGIQHSRRFSWEQTSRIVESALLD